MLDKSKIFGFSLNQYVNIIALIFLALFFLTKNPASKWDKSISGDGKSYYAYLTASVIYQDLDYQFVEDYEAKYYPPDGSLFKEFRQNFEGEVANKTFPGITILWLPFFLLAHFLSYFFGFATDGYSILYQYAIAFAAIFYLWLGLKWLSKLLISLGYSSQFILPTLILLAFGTNLYFYTIHDPSLTHVYNFTLLAGILYFTRKFYLEKSRKQLIFAIALFALAIVTRPTNLLMVLFIPLAIGNWDAVKQFFIAIFSDKKNVVGIILTLVLIGIYPIIWWFAQTGHFIVYSYGEEGFDFLNPNLFNILLSYEKGWLVYTPAIFLTVLGFISFYRKNKSHFFITLFGIILLAYVFSCWWIWTYGASYGQRVFVDYYAVIGILLVAGLTMIQRSQIGLVAWFVLAFSFIGLNELQTFQFKHGILPSIGATKSSYWGSYFQLKAIQKSHPITKTYETTRLYKTDFETIPNWLTVKAKTNEKSSSGQYAQFINTQSPYSGGLKERIPPNSEFIHISANIFCESNTANPKLVYELARNANNSFYESKDLLPFLKKNTWTKFYFTIDLDDKSRSSFTTYFYNPTTDKIWIDDLEIIFGKYK